MNTDKSFIPDVLAMMSSGQSLRISCASHDVSPVTFLRWVDADPALSVQYAHARAEMFDAQAEMLEDIGLAAANADSAVEVAGLRLQSDNRKWLLSKLASKKYGDRTTVISESTINIRALLDLREQRLQTLDAQVIDEQLAIGSDTL